MATTFEKSGSNVLITVGTNDPISAPVNAFIKPDPRFLDVIIISSVSNPANEIDDVRILVSDVTVPANVSRADLIEKLSADFFVGSITQALADLRYLRISEGEPIELYNKTEIDAFNAINLQHQLQKDILALGGADYIFPVGCSSAIWGSGVALVSGREYIATYIARKNQTVSKASFQMLTAQAVFTGSGFNGLGLYSVNKATGALVELTRTANDETIWKAVPGTKKTVSFLASQNLVAGEIYAVKFIYNSSAQTTAPTLGTGGSITNTFELFANGIKVNGYKAGQTDLITPDNYSAINTVLSTVWGILLHN